MIPKFIFDKSQTTLDNKELSILSKLQLHRKQLYNDFYGKIEILHIQKQALIKNYLQAIKEIDLEISQQKLKEEYELQSLRKKEIREKLKDTEA